jgi:hypothetical protein
VGDIVVVEVAIAALAFAVIIAILWRYDSGPTEWEDLLSLEALEAHELLRAKFQAEERVVDWTSTRAAAAGATFLVGLVPDRLQLLRRLELYARILAAAAPAPRRLQVRLAVLRQGFATLEAARGDADELAQAQQSLLELDQETLESCRVLALAVGRLQQP